MNLFEIARVLPWFTPREGWVEISSILIFRETQMITQTELMKRVFWNVVDRNNNLLHK